VDTLGDVSPRSMRLIVFGDKSHNSAKVRNERPRFWRKART
jgi:hypothetical protein